ncbi:MAG: hypothetical protein AAGA93_01895 [Actinomycetota bacterium]
MSVRRLLFSVLGAAIVLGAAGLLTLRAVTTSSARLSASTSGSGTFEAGTVDLAQPESIVNLLFDADGLYPGVVIPSCLVIGYDGSLDAGVRLHAANAGGDGLEDHVDLRLWLRRSGDCPDDAGQTAADRGPPTFDGLLGDLWRTHPDYDRGLILIDQATAGDRLVLDAEVELRHDPDAQGRTTEFTITLEARP